MISVVIPTYRSENNLPVLLDRICQVFRQENMDFEILVVDDNSPDNTLTYLKKISNEQPKIKVISLARNFGQQVAISAGLKHIKGDAVIIMDDDLQDPPEFIPQLIRKWEEGYDIVYAIKTNRKEGALKRLGYKLFYKILSKLSDIKIPQDSGDFCIMSKHIVTILNNMSERDRFVRGLRAWVGHKQIGIECDRGKRYSGEPAYTLSKMIKLSLDGVLSFSNKPLKLTSWFGFIMSFFAFIGIILTTLQKIVTYYYPDNALAVWPGMSSILLSILLIGGVQLISIGILGEYIGRIFNEVKQRPLFLIKETVGIDSPDK
ncbi:MAG: glycosyltransferase family 2 protein [Bacteroidota bacterium]